VTEDAREWMTWGDLGSAVEELAAVIDADGWRPDAVLALARDYCAQHGPDVRTAVLYEKPQSVVRCDFVWRRTDRWINFPWSTPSEAYAAAVPQAAAR
jgi:hypoxanthine phosphoribosyltransferase